MLEEVIVSGFGGQGILVVGKLLAEAGLLEGKYISWIPSYGPEMRGGSAYCMVTISDQQISSPVVETPSAALVFSLPSLLKFAPQVRPGGVLIINSSLVDHPVYRHDIHVYRIPASDIANELNNNKVANMVMMGAYLALNKAVSSDSVLSVMEKELSGHNHGMLQLNREAMEAGARAVAGP